MNNLIKVTSIAAFFGILLLNFCFIFFAFNLELFFGFMILPFGIFNTFFWFYKFLQLLEVYGLAKRRKA